MKPYIFNLYLAKCRINRWPQSWDGVREFEKQIKSGQRDTRTGELILRAVKS